MKDYKEMAESVLARRDEYNIKRDKNIKHMKKGIVGLCCMMVVVIGIAMADGQDKNQGKALQYEALNDVAATDENQTVLPPFNQNGEDKNVINDGKNSMDMMGKPIADLEETYRQEEVSGTELVEDMPSGKCGICIEWFSTRKMTEECWRFFGGFYHDENGKLGLYLTENTKKNRALICKQMGVDVKDVNFKTAQYTYRYLNEVQDKISQAMMEKKLPFVSSSVVYDDINRIKVCVTTDNQNDINKVLDYDTIGGAIIIEYATCGVIDLLEI